MISLGIAGCFAALDSLEVADMTYAAAVVQTQSCTLL